MIYVDVAELQQSLEQYLDLSETARGGDVTSDRELENEPRMKLK